MKLLSLEVGEQFRSLQPNFQIEFHKLTEKGLQSMSEFQPFCFAGLNGCGKSNVLEALAGIFYHLEFSVAKFRPKSFEKHYRRNISSPDVYVIKYLICSKTEGFRAVTLTDVVTITKEKGREPRMFVQSLPYDNKNPGHEISLIPISGLEESAAGKDFLPDLVVGYTSGENEILSLPFIKTRLVHYDEYKEANAKGYSFKEPETSLLFIDAEMSQAVLLACMIFEDDKALKPLKDELGIINIQSFRMNLNNQIMEVDSNTKEKYSVPILNHIDEIITKLKKCTPFSHTTPPPSLQKNEGSIEVLTLDFLIDKESKKAFREHFKSAFELFQVFQLLYELNNNSISQNAKEEVYKSKGVYTDGKIPSPHIDDKVFYFLDYLILKKIDGLDEPKELLLREFSDGEHQFIHTMGICLMLKDRRTLLLLDEPETHFNPSWRAKFIKVLSDSMEAGGSNHLLKDVILTSHSPYIISDCLPNNVIFFRRNDDTKKIEAKSAKELGFNTYGSSVEIISDKLFGYDQTIGDLSNERLNIIDNMSIDSLEEREIVKMELQELGDSIERDYILSKLYRANN